MRDLPLPTSHAIIACVFVIAAGCADDGSDPGCLTNSECGGDICIDGVCMTAVDASADMGPAPDAAPADSSVDVSVPDRGVDDAPSCVPTESPNELTCNGVDDDCNGRIDDVDVGDDGFCDCLTIGILGGPGVNPSANFEAWLEGRGTTVERLAGVEPLVASALSTFDILVVDNIPRSLEAEEVSIVIDFVEAGGGLMTMSGYSGSPDRANSLSLALGIRHGGILLSEPATEWTDHPIAMGISSVTFRGGFELSVEVGSEVEAMTVASIREQRVGIAFEQGDGRVFIWGDEWIQFDSEWGEMPMIQAFWSNVVNWIGPRNRCVIELI